MTIKTITKAQPEDTHRADTKLSAAVPLVAHLHAHEGELAGKLYESALGISIEVHHAEAKTDFRVAGHDGPVDPRETDLWNDREDMGVFVVVAQAGGTVIYRLVEPAVADVAAHPEPLGHTVGVARIEGKRRPLDAIVLIGGEPIPRIVFFPRVINHSKKHKIVGDRSGNNRITDGEMRLMAGQIIFP